MLHMLAASLDGNTVDRHELASNFTRSVATIKHDDVGKSLVSPGVILAVCRTIMIRLTWSMPALGHDKDIPGKRNEISARTAPYQQLPSLLSGTIV